jgi:hypothetical protein
LGRISYSRAELLIDNDVSEERSARDLAQMLFVKRQKVIEFGQANRVAHEPRQRLPFQPSPTCFCAFNDQADDRLLIVLSSLCHRIENLAANPNNTEVIGKFP